MAVRQGRRARLPCLRARPDRAALFYYRAGPRGPIIKWAFGVVARFEWPTLPRPDLDRAGQYYVGRCGNAVRVAPAPRAPPQRPSAVPRIRCATVRAAAPCVLAARGAPTSVPVARATRCWAPGLSIARAASRSRCHGVYQRHIVKIPIYGGGDRGIPTLKGGNKCFIMLHK